MRATVKNRVGVFHPQGFIDGNNAPAMLTIQDIDATKSLNVNMLLISLKKVIHFNKNGLNFFIGILENIRKEKGVSYGFCDYDEKKYAAILKIFDKNISFSLFKTLEIAYMFADKTSEEEPKNLLVWNEDSAQRSALAIELFERGHNPIVCQSLQEYMEKRSKKDLYEQVVDNTFLGIFGQKMAARVTGNAVIYTVGGFLDAEISDMFDLTYHTNSLNVGFTLFIFDMTKVISLNIHAVNFFSKVATSGAEYGASICIVGLSFEKTPKSFQEELEDAGILFFEKMEDILNDKKMLEDLGGSMESVHKSKRTLNKPLVNELSSFIKATVSTLEMMTNATAQKEKANIQLMDLAPTEEKMGSSIGFYGDLEGLIVLVFPKEIAKKACELLIGEKSDDEELILDSLGEFVNIIAGRVKQLLADENIAITITLPRTFKTMDQLLGTLGNKKGVQVDLAFDKDHFSFFLTR